jgi:hypothetical protein
MAKVEISAPDGFLKVHPNVTYVKPDDTVKWDIDVSDDFCVEIVFESQQGVVGPFTFASGRLSCARGQYQSMGRFNFETTPDQSQGIWKYDVFLYDVETGQQVDQVDPWIKFKDGN